MIFKPTNQQEIVESFNKIGNGDIIILPEGSFEISDIEIKAFDITIIGNNTEFHNSHPNTTTLKISGSLKDKVETQNEGIWYKITSDEKYCDVKNRNYLKEKKKLY